MIHPVGDKILALPIVVQEDMVQGTPVRFLDNGDGRLRAAKVTAAGDVSGFGCFLAYWISDDSQDVEFTGAPESTTFTLNTGADGTHNIDSGTECVALGGSKVALVRIDKNSLYNTPANLTSYTPSTTLKVHSDGYLCLDADDDIDVSAAKVVQNDTATIVVLLA